MHGEGVTLSRRALVVGALVLFLVGLATKTLLFPSAAGRSTTPQPADAAQSGAGPRRVEAPGVPIGFARNESGAVAAAVAYVNLGDLIVSLAPEEAASVLRRVASDSADGFVEAQLASFEQLQQALARGAGTARLRVGVLATRVEAFSRERARVSLWRVSVLSRDGMTNPGEQWATTTYELVWEDGDWRIWSETLTPGPTPVPTGGRAVAPDEFEAQLGGFVDYPGGD
ncbi:MAG: hypothetical protein ACRDZ1_15145 [Acidimicrobiia bacterium]